VDGREHGGGGGGGGGHPRTSDDAVVAGARDLQFGSSWLGVRRATDTEVRQRQARGQLTESPTTRHLVKDFYREFRSREKKSFQLAREYVLLGCVFKW
jgi:hypothetical protein